MPHSVAKSLFAQMGGDAGAYEETLQAVQSRLRGVEDPSVGPVTPQLWSETNDERASLAAGLAALYRKEPQLFDDVKGNPDRWLEIKAKAQKMVQENGR